MLQVLDVINSMLQSIGFSLGIYYCIEDKSKKTRLKLYALSILFFIDCSYITTILGNLSTCVFIVHLLCIGTIAIILRKNFKGALIGFSIIYMFTAVLAIICNNISYGIAENIKDIHTINIIKIVVIYGSQMILSILIIIRRKKIRNIYILITSQTRQVYILIISTFLFDWIIASNLIIYNNEKDISRNISIIIICAFFICLISYFVRIKQRADEIFKLNIALDEKNKELRKIKHDYGAQISYLYGMHLLKRYDELGNALKKIINNNKSVDSAVQINENNNVLLSLATQNALDEGIHVIIDDKCSMKKIDMDEMELYRIIRNIVNNAVKAMNGDGIIKIELFETIKYIVLKISNNGPKIPDENLENIFKAGFTTKNNSGGNHGFGLSIVKELIESSGGNITVNSSDEITEFKLSFPIKNKN